MIQFLKNHGYLRAGDVKKVWIEGWQAMPLWVINKAMDHLMVVLETCSESGGDNKCNG